MNIIKFIKKLFCKHTFYKYDSTWGGRVARNLLVETIKCCKKCGKVIR